MQMTRKNIKRRKKTPFFTHYTTAKEKDTSPFFLCLKVEIFEDPLYLTLPKAQDSLFLCYVITVMFPILCGVF